MAKQINIDWDIKIVQGKCNYMACPLKDTCLRFTSKEFDPAYGYITPPHGMTDDPKTSGYLPEKMFCFISNKPHRPAQRTAEIQD